VGREQPQPDTSATARLAGLSNEQALPSGIRLLRNVAGWWLVEECRRAWGDPPLDALLAQAARFAASEVTFDAADPRFVAPLDMPTAIAGACALSDDASRAQVVRAAVDSMAATTMGVIESLPRRGAVPCEGIRVFGGGARAGLYLDALRTRTTLPVSTGPIEAAALGNALAQGVALGAYSSADAARATLRAMEDDD
jgi:rhamnulokinase